jgi:hypothetical protein
MPSLGSLQAPGGHGRQRSTTTGAVRQTTCPRSAQRRGAQRPSPLDSGWTIRISTLSSCFLTVMRSSCASGAASTPRLVRGTRGGVITVLGLLQANQSYCFRCKPLMCWRGPCGANMHTEIALTGTALWSVATTIRRRTWCMTTMRCCRSWAMGRSDPTFVDSQYATKTVLEAIHRANQIIGWHVWTSARLCCGRLVQRVSGDLSSHQHVDL